MVRDEVEALWERLETWARANAPGMLDELRGPAAASELDAFEAASGLSLPEGLRASWLRHDGEEGPRYSSAWADGGELLSAAEMLDCWQRNQKLAEEPDPEEIAELVAEGMIEVEGPVHAVAVHARWVPFMLLNGGDRSWYVDLAPAPGGTPGQVIVVDPECAQWRVEAPSFEAFLAGYVADLEAGRYTERDVEDLPSREPPPPAPSGTNAAILGTTPLHELEQLPPGSEAEVAAVILRSWWFQKGYELSIWGGAIQAKGDLGRRPPSPLRVRVRVPEPRPGHSPVYEIVGWEPLGQGG